MRKASTPAEVDKYMQALKHPLADVVEALRQIILKADREVGEEIKWNAPTFFFTGEMAPSDPKLYKRYLVVSNLYRKDCIRLVFWGGAKAKDPTGLLEGNYADGRRLALFHSIADVKSKAKALRGVVQSQLKALSGFEPGLRYKRQDRRQVADLAASLTGRATVHRDGG